MITEQEILEYYSAYKEVWKVHVKIFGKDRVPNIPVLFSENLCRHILGYKDLKGKEYDAINGDLSVEIKATCLPNKTTTFSTQEPDQVVWIQFHMETDRIKFIDLDKSLYKKKTKAKRFTISNLDDFIKHTLLEIEIDYKNQKIKRITK
ncbi:MAG: hypothetical protein Q4G58_02540 [bacterium]|nr:hypothetical protein [bacterium]